MYNERTGPCLVEVGSRCHGGEGTWLPTIQECIGYTQVCSVYVVCRGRGGRVRGLCLVVFVLTLLCSWTYYNAYYRWNYPLIHIFLGICYIRHLSTSMDYFFKLFLFLILSYYYYNYNYSLKKWTHYYLLLLLLLLLSPFLGVCHIRHILIWIIL